jgi:monofunctional glycosyltransferase
LAFLGLRVMNPPTTGVQIERRVESWWTHSKSSKAAYVKHYDPVPLSQIAPELQHAVIAAEDGRFYRHWGIDWTEVEKAVEENRENGRVRGASTLTQQLVKNLFFTTHRNPARKALEYTLAPMATLLLGRQRVLELYLNVVEWGPGVYGAQAAAEYHYHGKASSLTRDQSARLAAILPSPLRRKPSQMDQYSATIEERLRLMGW